MTDNAAMLYQWREVRLKLQSEFTKDNLQKVLDWWESTKYHTHGFNFDDMSTWTDVWQYISDGYYTKSGNGLAMFFTIFYADEDKEVELWLIHDLFHSDIYLVVYVDGYILNRLNGEVEKYEDVKKDLNILSVHRKYDIINAIKKNNQG